MIIDTAVHLGIDAAEAGPLRQPIAVECPACYAIVRAVKIVAHYDAAHPSLKYAPIRTGGETN